MRIINSVGGQIQKNEVNEKRKKRGQPRNFKIPGINIDIYCLKREESKQKNIEK